MVYRILVVCTGNICRSPMGEVVLRQRFKEAGINDKVQVYSAAVSSEELGNPMDSRARMVLQEAGYQVGTHRARQVQPSDFSQFDLIIPMTRGHLGSLQRIAKFNDLGSTKTSKLRAELRIWNDFDAAAEGPDVIDPWYGAKDGFWDTIASVERGAENIVEYVQTKLKTH